MELDSETLQSLADSLGISVDKINELKESLSSITTPGGFDKFIKESLPSFAKEVNLSNDGLKTLLQYLKDSKDRFKELSEIIKNPVQHLEDLKRLAAESGDKLAQHLHIDSSGVKDFAEHAGAAAVSVLAFGDSSKVFDVVGKSSEGAGFQIETVAQQLAKLTGKSLEEATSIAKLADSHRNFEAGLFNLSAETGNLRSALSLAGTEFQNMEQTADSWSQVVAATAVTTGLTSEEVSGLYLQLHKIPGAMKEMDTGETVGGLRLFSGALTIAKGSGQTAESVLKIVADRVQTLGGTAGTAVEQIAELSSVSNQLTLPFDQVTQYVKGTTDALYEFGNTTDGNLKILAQLGPALEKVGASNRMVGDISEGVVQGIDKMTTAQKAFLSAQTGGPGGLKGAAQIDILLQEGKTDEVFKKIQQNLNRQFGGKVVTRQEAAQSDEAAGQFQKQIMFLTSGAGGNIAKDERSAAKLLEAMQKGLSDIPEELKNPQEAATRVANDGLKLQQRSNSFLHNIDINTKRMQDIGAVGAGYVARRVAGGDNETLKIAAEGQRKAAEANVISPILGKGEHRGSQLEDYVGDTFEDLHKTWGDIFPKEIEKTSNESAAKRGSAQPFGREIATASAVENKRIEDSSQQRGGGGNLTVKVMTECPSCKKRHIENISKESITKGLKQYDSEIVMQTHSHPE